VTPDRLHYRHPISPYLGENAARRVRANLSARESRLRRRKVSRRTKRSGILACVIIIDRLDKAHQLLPHNFRDVEARSGLHYPIRGSWLPAGPQMNSDRIVDSIIGKSVPRKEGRDKVTGRSQYVDDMALPHMLFGATVRSQIPRGCINKITFAPGIHWDEFVIVSAKDIPGKNCISLIGDDQPCLANEFVNHPEEPILLLAHPDRHLLPKAVEAVSIEYEPLPAIFTIEESERRSEIVWGADNIFKTYLIEKGEVDCIWEKADYIVEGEYTTGAQEQLYIENKRDDRGL